MAHAPRAGRSIPPFLDIDITPALHVARGLMHSDDLARDAVQEALFTLWSQDAHPADLRAWLVRAVVHRCLHALRTQRRRLRHEQEACLRCSDLLVDADPALLAEQAELHRAVAAALSSLPTLQRDILVLREIDGLDYDGIARELAIPVGTVRSRLFRARAALRDSLRTRLEREDGHARLAG